MKLKYVITEEGIVKDYLRKNHISRRFGRKIKWNGKIFINGAEAANWYPLHPGDELSVEYEEALNPEIAISAIEPDIVFEDQYLLIVRKPRELASQPSHKYFSDNLISRLKNHFVKNGIEANIHVISRLDFSTSGLALVAKEGYTTHLLDDTNIEKKYLAMVENEFSETSGEINLPIDREGDHPVKRKISATGKNAITKYRVLRSGNPSLLELTLGTGRCHQIRVHLSAIGHPVVGDRLYGHSGDCLMLHAYSLRFSHPVIKEPIEIVDLPDWLDENDILLVKN